MDNYRALYEAGFVESVTFVVLLAVVPLLLAVLIAPLLAVLADRAGRVARLATRGVLALPLAGHAPAAVYLGWRLHRVDGGAQSRGAVIMMVAVTSFGLVVAVAATAYLAALRNRSSGRSPLPALLTVGGLLALGVIAVALQSYTVGALTPVQGRGAPLVGVFQSSFGQLRFGVGAAGSVLLLAVLGVLGLVAVGLLLATRARIEVEGRWPTAPTGGDPLATGLVVVALVVFVAVVGWALAPWLRHGFEGVPEARGGVSLATVLANTWLPTLIGATVSVGLAAVAGFGIGALRPLGRWSELLLLPFAPWLFVGTGPLAIEGFFRARELGQVNTFLGLIPPGWVSIPALVAFTLLFRGQQARGQHSGGTVVRTLVLPALPMLVLIGLLTWLIQAQQLLWPSIVSGDPENFTAPLAAQFRANRFGPRADGAGLGSVLPVLILLLFLVAFVVLQTRYLDRLAFRVGRDDAVAPVGPTGVPTPRGPVAGGPAQAGLAVPGASRRDQHRDIQES
ncbi:hypothetical protein C5N14_08625 [Micromonospora sp. MW-13]|uniref:sugar ABC transporter permease n=1 Tax=Micromonospora sp. MW-13 TaxID=2094022 RepID=UPI000E437578|nr:sugar ABC transporter permease [Micromonospora sp. MW-13]RGC69324.1 hypothetical protein C5N14_08625 [Micromonospora sp. MW-13]